ncbi:MAG: recombinase family protein [Streptosporangiaceae bacterium]
MHEHKRLGRGIELAALAKQLRAAGIGLEFLAGELQGSHDPSGIVFTVLAALSGMEREYIRDRTLEGHESARARGKAIGGAAVTDEAHPGRGRRLEQPRRARPAAHQPAAADRQGGGRRAVRGPTSACSTAPSERLDLDARRDVAAHQPVAHDQ